MALTEYMPQYNKIVRPAAHITAHGRRRHVRHRRRAVLRRPLLLVVLRRPRWGRRWPRRRGAQGRRAIWRRAWRRRGSVDTALPGCGGLLGHLLGLLLLGHLLRLLLLGLLLRCRRRGGLGIYSNISFARGRGRLGSLPYLAGRPVSGDKQKPEIDGQRWRRGCNEMASSVL